MLSKNSREYIWLKVKMVCIILLLMTTTVAQSPLSTLLDPISLIFMHIKQAIAQWMGNVIVRCTSVRPSGATLWYGGHISWATLKVIT